MSHVAVNIVEGGGERCVRNDKPAALTTASTRCEAETLEHMEHTHSFTRETLQDKIYLACLLVHRALM